MSRTGEGLNDTAQHHTEAQRSTAQANHQGRDPVSRPPGADRRLLATLLTNAFLLLAAAFTVLASGTNPQAVTMIQASGPRPVTDRFSATRPGRHPDGVRPGNAPQTISPVPPKPTQAPPPPQSTPSVAAVVAASVRGIPDIALQAYVNAAAAMARTQPSCGLNWSLLAAIGQVESNHGRFGGAQLRADGTSSIPVQGPALDGGSGFALITNGDGSYSRAIGPMQFLPSSWAAVAADGNGDGRTDVYNIFDAALGAALYLCANHSDLHTDAGLRAAVYRYNHSDQYVALVLALAAGYASDTVPVLPAAPIVTVPAPPIVILPPATDTGPGVAIPTSDPAPSSAPASTTPPPAETTTPASSTVPTSTSPSPAPSSTVPSTTEPPPTPSSTTDTPTPTTTAESVAPTTTSTRPPSREATVESQPPAKLDDIDHVVSTTMASVEALLDGAAASARPTGSAARKSPGTPADSQGAPTAPD